MNVECDYKHIYKVLISLLVQTGTLLHLMKEKTIHPEGAK